MLLSVLTITYFTKLFISNDSIWKQLNKTPPQPDVRGYRKGNDVFHSYTATMLVHFLVASLAAGVSSSIVRLPCKIHANFDVVLNGLALIGTPLANFTQASRRQCVLHCISHQHCSSANHNEQTLSCDIFNSTFVKAVKSLIEKPGWTFLASSTEVIWKSF